MVKKVAECIGEKIKDETFLQFKRKSDNSSPAEWELPVEQQSGSSYGSLFIFVLRHIASTLHKGGFWLSVNRSSVENSDALWYLRSVLDERL